MFIATVPCRRPGSGRTLRITSLVLMTVMATACADLQTVGRKTPFTLAADGPGLAIHLDAQQRLVIMAGNKFCAEPSPDALAAYASSLGFGLSVPGRGAASASDALQSSAGSIGLRTQSITLMRDSLYRLCEASMNGTINDLQTAEFLRRSQDLTAVIVAIEQLTGAVRADQVILTGSASAQGIAQLQSNQAALDAARADQSDAASALTVAQQNASSAAAALPARQQALAAASDALDQLPATATPEQIAAARQAVSGAQAALDRAGNASAAAEQARQDAQDRVDDSAQLVETIEQARDSALASSRASAAGGGQLGNTTPRAALSDAATVAVAQAVTEMVTRVLNKDYSMDTCLMFLTAGSGDRPGRALTDIGTIKDACLFLIAARVTGQAKGAALTPGELLDIKDAVLRDRLDGRR